jgi:hypothetical protein
VVSADSAPQNVLAGPDLGLILDRRRCEIDLAEPLERRFSTAAKRPLKTDCNGSGTAPEPRCK